jgi:hypothetical protein
MKPHRFVWIFVLCFVPPLLGGDDRKADKPTGVDPKNAGKAYQVPYRLTDTQHILVRAKVNGKGPFNFIIDTGAPMLFISVPIAKKIGLEADKNHFTTLDRFEMEGGAAQEKIKCRIETPFQLEGMNALGLPGAELHGIIGYTVLAHYKMEFDFTRDKMSWTQLAFAPPQPQPLKVGKKDGAGMMGLDMLGPAIKFLAALSGIKPAPPPVPRGFFGLELEEAGGAVTVKSVVANGPAAKAGLKTGDRIAFGFIFANLQHVQGNDVKSLVDVIRNAAVVTAGQTVRFSIERGQEKKVITITAGEGL